MIVKRYYCLIFFTLLPAGICQVQTLPDALFTHITSDGTYTMLADKDNHIGSGEQVAIPKDFYMARHAVSNAQWQQFMAATDQQTPSYWSGGAIPEGKEQHPVVWVSVDEAQAYCQWLETQYPDYVFRLPTQGEWEYAACGSQRTVYPWGCYNMSGNCWEWTSTIEEATNGAEKGQMVNIIKGGSWYATKGSCKVSYRGEGRKGSGRYATVGIRVVAEKRSAANIDHIQKPCSQKHQQYELSGRRASANSKGVHIADRHKVVIK